MSNTIENMPAHVIGEKLKIARENAGLTQSEAADAIGAARTTLVAIEKGQRRIKVKELHILCTKYGTSINALLRDEAAAVNFEPQFRKLPECREDGGKRAAQLITTLARAELELENLLGIERVRNDPPERSILPGDIRAQAENDALELRQWLGLGLGPITDMLTLLEMSLGARVYLRKLDSEISGVFVYDKQTGPCILLNANHPATRRALSAAHELAHFVSRRKDAEIFRDSLVSNSREERYADAFAPAFLMPARTLMHKFKEVTAGSGKLTRRHIIILAHFFGVSREALVRRLEALKLVKQGAWDWFSNEGGISDKQAAEVLGDRTNLAETNEDFHKPTTLRLSLLTSEVYRRGLLSEGQLSRLLDIGRIELRQLLDEEAEEEGDTDNVILL